MTLINSWGGLDSNSYIDVTEANSYIKSATLNNDAWFDLSSAQRAAALMRATADIDAKNYVGHRYFFDQALQFPRQLRSAFPYNFTTSETITQDVFQRNMQRDVQRACALQALKVARDGGQNNHLQNIANGIKSISESVGPIQETVQYGKAVSTSGARIDSDALALLQPWLVGRRIYRA